MTEGQHMAREAREAPEAFARAFEGAFGGAFDVAFGGAAGQPAAPAFRAAYTVARGSSDAAALVLAYEAMRETGRPWTSLPPSVFSLGGGVALDDALVLLVSQSGASDDLVASARGARARGAHVVAVTNVAGSPVEREAHRTLAIAAGPEIAVPATKTVVGAIGAGTALLAALAPAYAPRARAAARLVARAGAMPHPDADRLAAALAGARSVFVVGRDTGLGAAHEIALKLKECAALHAEAYSASEVLHGPLQLAEADGLTALVLDAGLPGARDSLDTAEARLRAHGAAVHRVAPGDLGAASGDLTPAAGAALLLCALYPVVLAAALARGLDPDAPAALSKVTRTT